ncbi:MAG: heavy-metal-associated domain-containing protein [Flavobacteriales bacterium]|nr:MAG: heavy-metal-associated domain-containing protein [Flavobacteriales bacterium]
MKRKYKIMGMTCNGCKTTVENSLNLLEQVKSSKADIRLGELTLILKKDIDLKSLQNSIPKKYFINKEISPSDRLTEIKSDSSNKKSKLEELKPLFLILFYITSASILLNFKDWNRNDFMLNFMGLFFIIFSFFKMLDLKGFSESFKMYDPLAKKISFYGMLYPFIETALGLMFLMKFEVFSALILSVLILGLTTIGVTKILISKKSIQCACLGTVLKLPMTEATFIENVIMIFMSIFMLSSYTTW